MECAGLPVTLLDTAGDPTRTPGVDEVEAIGVRRSVAAATGADAVIVVVDSTEGWTAADADACAGILHRGDDDVDGVGDDEGESAVDVPIAGGGDEWANAKARLHKVRRHERGLDDTAGDDDATRDKTTAILAVNKTDLDASGRDLDAAACPRTFAESSPRVFASRAVTGAGLEELESELGRIVEGGAVGAEGGAWTRRTSRAAGGGARAGAARARASRGSVVDGNLPVDFWTIDLREASMALGGGDGGRRRARTCARASSLQILHREVRARATLAMRAVLGQTASLTCRYDISSAGWTEFPSLREPQLSRHGRPPSTRDITPPSIL